MLKRILLGATIVTASAKIVTNVCNEYEALSEEDRPKGWNLLPFILKILAKESKVVVERCSTKAKDVFEYFAGMVGMNFEEPKRRINSIIGLSVSAVGVVAGFVYAGVANAKLDIKES